MPAVEHFNINHQLLDTETLICHQILYKVNVALNLNLELQLINIYRQQSDIETPIYIMEWLISCLSSQGAYSKSRFLNCVRKFRPIMSKLAKARPIRVSYSPSNANEIEPHDQTVSETPKEAFLLPYLEKTKVRE